MKVLFVSSGNSKEGINPVVKIQGESLRHKGVELDYFGIKGKGFRGYLKNIPILRRFLCNNHFDIIHAHFFLSGTVAWIAGAKPLIVSLMGSEVNPHLTFKIIFKIFKSSFKGMTIVKSKALKEYCKMKDAVIIPNGVDLRKFKVIEKDAARKQVGFESGKKYIIWVSEPERWEKNIKLAQAAFALLKESTRNLEFKVVYDVEHDLIPAYMNAADVLLLTSLWEGSPNVIKEAMACNCPIASVDVGDVREVIGKTDGCYITSFEPGDVAEKLGKALAFGKRTNGREYIQHLDSNLTAQKIIKLYEKVLER